LMNSSGGKRVSSTANPSIKSLLRLSGKRERDRTGLFAVEGVREILRALEGGIEPVSAYLCRAAGGDRAAELFERIAGEGAELIEVSSKVFERIAYRSGTGGLIMTARIPDTSLDRIEPAGGPVLVADGIEKPGNHGAMLRSVDGAGGSGVILTGGGTDLFNPNVIRASLGAVFAVPAAAAGRAEAIGWLREKGLRIIVTTPGATSPYTEADLASPCALVVGSEDSGASDEWLREADLAVSLPMLGIGDSLNVSVSAAVLLYEALRQRRRESERTC